MKTISIRLEDSIYEELSDMLDAMGQTKQTFYETFTRTALRERSIPFIISAPDNKKNVGNDRKMEAFKRLEASRKKKVETIDYEKEREEGRDEMCETIERYANEVAVEREIDRMIKTCIKLNCSKEKTIKMVLEDFPQISEEQVSKRVSEIWEEEN